MADKEKGNGIGRRQFLKAAATTPVVGAFAYSVNKKQTEDKEARERILDAAGAKTEVRQYTERKKKQVNIPAGAASKILNIGFIGIGGRGYSLMRSAGFIAEELDKNGIPVGSEVQPSLNIRCTAVCDLFTPNVERAVEASGGKAKAYRTYQELMQDPDVDAVVIATPDFYHVPIAKAAAEAGKHVYVEKCMTINLPQAFELREAVKKAGIIFQLGHQNRNSNSYDSAMEVMDKGLLGKVTLVQCYNNRNSLHGAWYYDIPKEHGPMDAATGPRNLDWEQYTAITNKRPYDPNRFFRWRCYWDYGTGLAGDLLTHELDVINMVMQMGIPTTCVASGGVSYFKEYVSMMTAEGEPISADQPLPAGAQPRPDVPACRREVPDLFQVTYEWPERDLTVVYNCTLGNEWRRGQIYLGDEATMDLTRDVEVYADPRSKRYADAIKNGLVNLDEPMIVYRNLVGKGVEAMTSATSQWTVAKGLLWTYRDGRRVDTTYLHIKNWVEHIRANDHDTMCNIDDGFQEAITANMATESLLTGSRIRWNEAEGKIEYDFKPDGVSMAAKS